MAPCRYRAPMAATLQAQSVELLQTLIRNECVNDGSPESGHEDRNADVLQQLLEGAGLDVAKYSSAPGRTSLVARIEGSDPHAPKLCLMGHTDVVPVNPSGWTQDPFGGDLIAGEVWGRGALDMLNITATMAVSFRELARSGFRPRGDLIFFGVADEENGGAYGAGWMVEHHWDAIACDYVLTESGGWTSGHRDGKRLVAINVAEKGLAWRRLRVSGTPGHGSLPWRADNALIKAAEIVRRLDADRPKAELGEMWAGMIASQDLPPATREMLLDPRRVQEALDQLPLRQAKRLHACSHMTISPNVIHGGQKTNIVPDSVILDLDIRTLPGTGREDVDSHLRAVLGDLASDVEIEVLTSGEADASASPIDTPMWDVLRRHVRRADPDAEIVATLGTGGTDARYFRPKGAVAYGAALLSADMTIEQFGNRFHGNDERIDVGSLGLSADLWVSVAQDLLG
ncbi:MAG: M20/M25/M40 family metallo-hydrolase [Acidimicrobiales bacterium]